MKCNLISLFLEIVFRCLQISNIIMQPLSVSDSPTREHPKIRNVSVLLPVCTVATVVTVLGCDSNPHTQLFPF
jgi:hypothetical protein